MEQNSPQLEDRFLEPPGWRWHSFEHKGRRIRYGCVFPDGSIPDAVIVCLQGVREFSEKYFETARWALEHNMAFWVFDWVGQGLSTRYLKNPQKRHGEDFAHYVDDLHAFILGYVKHSSVHPDKGRIPLALLAHSMGANVGMRYLAQYPDMFECAAFSAPMIALKVFEHVPQKLALGCACVLNLLAGSCYVPFGGDWSDTPPPPGRLLSGDAQRSLVHSAWSAFNPDLRCGAVTLGWVYQAQRACLHVQHPDFARAIKTHCLFGIPGHDHLVDNTIGRRVISRFEHAKTLFFPDGHHEILMEVDNIRYQYLDHFYTLIKERIIDRPESLKPF